MGQESFAVPALVIVLVATVGLLRHFAASDTSWAVRLQVMLSWTLSLSIVALVPADVAATANGEAGARPGLATLWDLSYWTTFCLTWFVLPIHQIYEDAGDFSPLGRLRTSVRENLIFYAVIVLVALVGVALLLANSMMTAAGLSAFSVTASNMFGICTGIFLLGYGLVEVPRSVWRGADVANRPAAAHRRVGVVAASLEHAYQRARRAVRAAETTREVIPRGHELRWAMRIIERELPEPGAFGGGGGARGGAPGSSGAGNGNGEDSDDDVLDYDYDELSELVALRRELNRKLRVYRRTAAQYAEAVEAALEAEAVAESGGGANDRGCGLMGPAGGEFSFSARRFRRLGGSSERGGRWAPLAERLEWWWKCRARPIAARALALVLGAFSVLTVWAESTMWTTQAAAGGDGADLSPFSFWVRESRTQAGIHVAVMVPLGYMCFCAYYSLFRLGMFSFYSLVPRHTDSFSLLVNAALVCRYSAPLSLNFLMLVPSAREAATGRATVFHDKMAKNVPLAAQRFNAVFPAFLGLYCAAVAFGFFDTILRRCAACFGSTAVDAEKNLKFDSDDRDAERDLHVAEGKAHVDRERAALVAAANRSSSDAPPRPERKLGAGSEFYVELAPAKPARDSAGGGGFFGGLFTRASAARSAEREADLDAELDELADGGAGRGGGGSERRGLLGRRGGPETGATRDISATRRAEESRAERWERNKERLANAVSRGGAGARSGRGALGNGGNGNGGGAGDSGSGGGGVRAYVGRSLGLGGGGAGGAGQGQGGARGATGLDGVFASLSRDGDRSSGGR